MQVHHALATAGKVALGCLVMLAFAALAIVGTNVGLSLSAGSLRSAAPAAFLPSPAATPAEVLTARFPSYFSPSAPPATPTEILAARFPADEAASQPPAFSTARVVPAEHGETFDLSALSGMATVEPAWPAADGTAPAEAATTEPPQARRPSARSPNVVNDAMIASIRQRLKLTAEQDKLWPPVEAALRKIVYTRAALNPQRGPSAGPTAYIDPSSPEVHELKSAALPLLMRLNDQQKREVKELAFVMGLEAVASQF
jgi:hypothetical protein